MIYLKTSAVGLDVVINDIQSNVFNALGWSNYNAYHKVYKNETSKGIVPEWYEDIEQQKRGEYTEVFLNDNLDASSFFYASDIMSTVDVGRLFGTVVSLVFQVDLKAITGVGNTRNDEEINQAVTNAINSSLYGKVNSIHKGIANTYSEFDTSQIQFDDMQPFYCVRFDIDVAFEYDQTNCSRITPANNNTIVYF